jgi:hypothetical protein
VDMVGGHILLRLTVLQLLASLPLTGAARVLLSLDAHFVNTLPVRGSLVGCVIPAKAGIQGVSARVAGCPPKRA